MLSLVCCCNLTLAGDKPPAAAIATSSLLSTRAGAEIIKQGGNAFDAAVAITAALAVVEPYSSGLGGGGLWLLYRARDGKQVLIDGRERAPQLAHWRLYRETKELGSGASANTVLNAAIPGIPAGIVHLAQNYGRLPLSITLKPAINYAKKGFYVNDEYRLAVIARKSGLLQFPETARIFLDHGEVPRTGYWLKQKDLAKTMTTLATQGHAGFYQGALADQMIRDVNKYGGIWTVKDLLSYQIKERDPLIFSYRDMRVVTAPPPSAGGVVLSQAMNMLTHFDLAAMDKSTRTHHVIEALRRAYRDSAVYLGDPDVVDIPLYRLLNPDYLEGLALTIEPDRATPSDVLGDTPGLAQSGSQTTHFSIIDAEGNRVAATLSSSAVFGSGFVPAGTGVLLNNSMDDFSIMTEIEKDGQAVATANIIQPGKRPLTSMTPAFFESADRVAVLGTPGGSRIISMLMLAALDFSGDRSLGTWILQPRYHHQYLPDVIEFEHDALSEEEQARLREMGYKLQEYPGKYGDVQVVTWDRQDNRVLAASDPRGVGAAVVVPESDLRQ